MKDGGPAFPVPAELCQDLTVQEQRGMTLRDYFAAKALPISYDFWRRDLEGNRNDHDAGWNDMELWIESAYEIADAMLEERSKT